MFKRFEFFSEQVFFDRFIKIGGIRIHNLPKLKNLGNKKFVCVFCETPLNERNYTKEHLIPVSRYGNNSAYNVKPCCLICNQEKADRDILEYIKYLSFKTDTAKRIENAKKAFYDEYYNL